jgi:hypothetical protein
MLILELEQIAADKKTQEPVTTGRSAAHMSGNGPPECSYLRGPAPFPGLLVRFAAVAIHMTAMKQTPLFLTVRADGPPLLERYPDGFPVDGDALHGTSLKKRARNLIISDPDLLAAAKSWLGVGTTMIPREEELTPAQIARLVEQLFSGGAARFVSYAPGRTEDAA